MIWLRLGAYSEYESFDDLDRVIEEFKSFNVTGPVKRAGQFGITCPGYKNYNHISLYHGNIAENPTGGITDQELLQLNKELKED